MTSATTPGVCFFGFTDVTVVILNIENTFYFLFTFTSYSYVSFLMQLIEILRILILLFINNDFIVLHLAMLWSCYGEKRGLHSATFQAVSYSIMNCA